jgi:hypothetical protein
MDKPDVSPAEEDEVIKRTKEAAKEFLKSINRIYITFRAMETRNLVT